MYSHVQDLLLGNIPLPAGDKSKRAVERASDEIDSILGIKYKVPIIAKGQYEHQVRALLRNVNNWLASGRLIEELTASSQTVEVHAYANNLINQALQVLQQILRGEILLPGVDPIGGDDGVGTETGPIVVNADESSQTNWYYDEIDNPLYGVQNPSSKLYFPPGRVGPYPWLGG